mgnify:CR=1 FL=1
MSWEKVEVGIEGLTPLLMHKIGAETMEKMQDRGHKITDIPTPEEEAEDGAYKNEKGELVIPARCIKASIVRASSWYKLGKRSLKQFIAGCVRIEPYEVSLGVKKYEIDARPVVIGRGNRVIRHRPMIKQWKCTFGMIYNKEVFTTKESLEVLKKVIEEAGMRCGLLDNRPEKGGENGTFKIVSWKD